jgi:hypothetical protein
MKNLIASLVVIALAAVAVAGSIEIVGAAHADGSGSAVMVEPFDAGAGSALAPSVTVNAGSGATVNVEAPKIPDPVAEPAESASLVWKLYKAGHLIPALIMVAFFGLMLAQRWVAWLRTGYRKLAVASVLGGLAMIAERAAAGTSPSLAMLAGAIGVSFALYVKGEGEPKEPAAA